MSRFSTLMGLTLAAAAGAFVGVLMAPRKGSETRANLTDFVKSHYPANRTARLEALADQIENEVREDVDDLRDIVRK